MAAREKLPWMGATYVDAMSDSCDTAFMDKDEFARLALSNPVNPTILSRLPDLKAPDGWAGVRSAVYQTVWNVRTGRAPAYGIKDYDIMYFDPDPSWEAEDAVIRRGNALFADLGVAIEVRNQGRVHIWYEENSRRPTRR